MTEHEKTIDELLDEQNKKLKALVDNDKSKYSVINSNTERTVVVDIKYDQKTCQLIATYAECQIRLFTRDGNVWSCDLVYDNCHDEVITQAKPYVQFISNLDNYTDMDTNTA